MNTISGYRQSRKDELKFNETINNYSVFVPSFGNVIFRNAKAFTSMRKTTLLALSIFKNFIIDTLVKIAQTFIDIDQVYHLDVISEGYYYTSNNVKVHKKFFFDVKNVQIENICKCNYSLSDDCYKYNYNAYDNNWITFRLNVMRNNKPIRLNSFIVVNAYELFNNCNAVDGKTTYSLKDIMKKCENKFFIGDEDELYEFEAFHRLSTGLHLLKNNDEVNLNEK